MIRLASGATSSRRLAKIASLSLGLMTFLMPAYARHSNGHAPPQKHMTAKSEASHAIASGKLIAMKITPTATLSKPSPVAKLAGASKTNKPIRIAQAGSTAGSQREMDSALLSILRDISKAIKESNETTTLENSYQKLALATALEALDKALTNAQINSDRIVSADLKDRLEKGLQAQSWNSGDLQLSNGAHASLNVLWAKKINGLLNVSISGNCGNKTGPSGESAGEFVVVVNGKSTLDSGLDIQTQSPVNFWLGKLTHLSVDAGTADTVSSNPAPVLMQGTAQITLPVNSDKIVVELKPVMGANPSQGPTANNSANSTDLNMPTTVTMPEPEAPILSSAIPELPSTPLLAPVPQPGTPTSDKANVGTKTAAATEQNARAIAPERAIAGDFITVLVLNAQQQPEPTVDVCFNGKTAKTSNEGKATYEVPDETLPGPSLQITLPAHPESHPLAINVLQPLTKRVQDQLPSIDHISNRTSGDSRLLTIDGHNFDGRAEHNKVLVDGSIEATVLVASPVQIKATIDGKVTAGQHNVSVTTNGLRSNLAQCELSSLRPDVASAKRKLVARPGTSRKI